MAALPLDEADVETELPAAEADRGCCDCWPVEAAIGGLSSLLDRVAGVVVDIGCVEATGE